MRGALKYNLLKGSGAPSWVPAGAFYSADFINDRYWAGTVSSLTGATSFSRNSIALGQDSTGAYTQYAINALRKTNIGVQIEPQRSNLLIDSNSPGVASWTLNSVTQASLGGGWSSIRETATTAFHRLFRTSGLAVTNGQTYGITFAVKKVNRRYLCLRASVDGGSTNKQVGYDLDTVSVTYAAAGFTGFVSLVGDVYLLGAVVTAASTSITHGLLTADAAIVNDTIPSTVVGNTANGFDFYNAGVELGTTGTSPIIVAGTPGITREADALVLKLPNTGTHDLTFTFDDGSTQIISDVAGGDYAVPTNLNRPRVKTVDWRDL